MKKPAGLSGKAQMRSSGPASCQRVAAVMTGRVSVATAKRAAALGAGLIELRVDTFAGLEACELAESIEKLKKNTGLPILLTIRSDKEGGRARIPEKERAALYEALIPLADLVDIELASSGILKSVVKSAKRAKKRVIVSHHDFEATPREKKLKKIIDSAREAGADIVKIAAMVNSPGDLRRLAGLLVADTGLIVIGMGPMGCPSRVFFPMLGSLLTYCPITESTAPGQLGLRETVSELRRYGFGGHAGPVA